MNRTEAWGAWVDQDRLIRNAAHKQGSIIKAYLDTNQDNLKQVGVKKHLGSDKVVITMTEITPSYYYHSGNFYQKIGHFVNGGMPLVAMLVGNELSDLWKSMDFIQNLLGMETEGGRMAPYE